MRFTVLASIVLAGSPAIWAKEPDQKPSESPKRLQATIGVLRDSGSRIIEIPAFGDLPACKIYVDSAGKSKTPGEIFLAKDFVEERDGKQLPWEQADKLLTQLEQVLLAHYGAAKLLEIVLHPIEPGGHVSEEEFGERIAKDPGFSDRLEARYLMDEIIAYRTTHGPLLKRK